MRRLSPIQFRSVKQIPIALTLAIMSLALTQTGCVRRRLTVRTMPENALIVVDDQPIGRSPVSTSFRYYGTRKIQAIKDGYETVTIQEKISPPWYQWPGVDFVAENLWPREIRDERAVEIELEPQKVVPRDRVIAEAERLRGAARQGYVVNPGQPGNPFDLGPSGAPPDFALDGAPNPDVPPTRPVPVGSPFGNTTQPPRIRE
jgi:hypothetical protein